MNNTLKYKGYIGSIELDEEDNIFYGKLLFINGLITYESFKLDVPQLEQAFHEAVDEYLADCKELDIVPEKTCKGNFNVRISHELHLKANLLAYKNSESLNSLVKRAINVEVSNKTVKHDITIEHNIILQQEIKGVFPKKTQEKKYEPELRLVK